MPHFLRQKKVAAVGIVFALLAAAGAYAYWTTTGSGTGDATHATTAAVVVNQTSPVNTLYPGVTVPLSGTFTNNGNAGIVTVTSVTVAITSVTGSVGSPECTTDDYEVVSNTSNVTDGTVNPGATANGAWSGLSVRLKDLGTNQDACKNATLHLTYTSA